MNGILGSGQQWAHERSCFVLPIHYPSSKTNNQTGSQQQTGDGSWVPGCWLELSTILREVSQCPEMAPIRTLSLLKVPVQMLVHKVSQFD